MQTLVEDFLQFLRHERGQADNTARTYAALLGKFIAWAEQEKLADWRQVELKHLMAFLQQERTRPLADEPKESTKRKCLSRNRRAPGVLQICRERKNPAAEHRRKSLAAAPVEAAAKGADEFGN